MAANACTLTVKDLSKPSGPILTGIGYLDHMIDQFNSHAQIGVSIIVGDAALASSNGHEYAQSRNRNAVNDQGELMFVVGCKFGTEIKRLMEASSSCGTSSRFSCPLDEALVECELSVASQ